MRSHIIDNEVELMGHEQEREALLFQLEEVSEALGLEVLIPDRQDLVDHERVARLRQGDGERGWPSSLPSSA